MAHRIHPSTSRGRRVWWLLDLQWAGQTIRLSDTVADIDDDGASLHYHGALDAIDVDDGIEWLSDASASPATAQIAAVLPVDVPKRIASGWDLASATGTLSRWVEGTSYASRRVVIAGQVTDPEYGASGEPVSFSLELLPWEGTTTLPPPSYAVEGANFDAAAITSLPASGVGLAYPVVIGHPGQVSTLLRASGIITGSQAVYADQRRTLHGSHFAGLIVVLSYGHSTVGSVYLKTVTDTTFKRYQVVNTYDDRGHPIAIASWWYTKSGGSDLYYDGAVTYTWSPPTTTTVGSIGSNSAPTSIQPSSGAEPVGTFVAWLDDSAPSGGGFAGRSGTAMRGAGEVLAKLIQWSGRPVDHGRWSAAEALLERFRLDFVIDAEVDAWEFIRAHLLPILPMSIVSGPDGIAPVVWRYDATEADAVAHLDADRDPSIERASQVSYDRDIRNDIQIDYALAVMSGSYLGRLRYTGNALADEDDAVRSYPCELSQRRYLQPDGRPMVSRHVVESAVIYDDGTAHAVCQWMASAYALARRRVEYLAPESEWGWLERGAVITISHDEIHLDAQVAIVEGIRLDGSPLMRLRLLMIESPVRDSRAIV